MAKTHLEKDEDEPEASSACSGAVVMLTYTPRVCERMGTVLPSGVSKLQERRNKQCSE